MINIFLTFDYELPLGGVAKNYADSLFQPTEELLQMAQSLNVPITLFADILSYVRFEQLGFQSYAEPFKAQIQQALQMGHDVQLHLHPHWLKTKIEADHFNPDSRFALGNYTDTEIEHFIKMGVESLTQMAQSVHPSYQCVAFRAGGYNLTLKNEVILPLLEQNGIRFDSSMAHGYYFWSELSHVDYRKLPNQGNWLLDQTKILEIPIATKPKSLFEVPTFLKLRILKDRAVHRGKMIHEATEVPWKEKWNMMGASRMLTVDNFTYSPKYLNSILEYHLKKYSDSKDIHLALIGHPKSMGPYSLQLLKQFVKDTQDKHGSQVRFVTFDMLAKEQE